MNQKPIEIHEFSTGIRPERTANGGWISTGFTGQYMNMTLESVPPAVERSIANREFAVTEGASTDQPAIIGREVGSGNDVWSVVAVVTRGRDEIGRSLSVYRYFLCEGDNNLWKILDWWESQGMPRFNPFDSKEVGQPTEFSNVTPILSPEDKNLADTTPAPILLSPEQCDLKKVNIFALRKRSPNDQLVSWAFNVEALEKPTSFQVIQPASNGAYEILDRAIKNVPQVLVPVFADEEALKSAIRGLINSSKVKPEAVQTIADALKYEQITNEYWHKLFDGQGAKTAISQKIYSPEMVRLITLRAMVIPETITEFLAWLNVKAGKKPDENQTVSLKFQSGIGDLFPKNQLVDGIKFILPKLLKEEITPETVYSFLMVKGSAWFVCRQDLIFDTESDLKLINTIVNCRESQAVLDAKKNLNLNNIWEKLIINLQSRSRSYYYKPLAELFEKLEAYSLAAYFYQISEGQVPKDIFDKVDSRNNRRSKNQLTVLGLRLEPEFTWFESFINFLLQEFIVPIQIVFPISLLFLVTGVFIGSQFFGKHNSLAQSSINSTQQASTQKNTSESSGIDNTTGESCKDTIELKDAANDSNFQATSKAIDKIVETIKRDKKANINNQKIMQILQEASQANEQLSYDKAFVKASTNNNKFIKIEPIQEARKKIALAICEYQRKKDKDIEATGYINPGDKTAQMLEEEVKNKNNKSS